MAEAKDKIWRIEVGLRDSVLDAEGQSVKAEIDDLGIAGVDDVRFIHVFFIDTFLPKEDIERISSQLLSDTVVNDCAIDGLNLATHAHAHVIEVTRKPGVMDPVEASTLKGISDMGLSASAVHTARKYLIYGDITEKELEQIGAKILANTSIEDFVVGGRLDNARPAKPTYQFELKKIDLLGADDDELMRISREGQLSLNLTEMKTIQNYFSGLERPPTDVELETLAQTWSEHCVHKTLRGIIEYDGEEIDNLLKSTIARVTEEINAPWCVSVFEDNAGIIRFDEDYNVCFKVETHNHPSAIEPYGGAGTGIGGVIRDPMGTGLGARPIVNTDIFCFAPPDFKHEDLPKGVLHPKRVMKGVISGVRDYGNRMGIPTANGAVFFDNRYLGNPLVYCGNVGLIPKDKCTKAAKPGDLIIVVGGRTGRDGIHGATFSSIELTHESEVISSGAVQIGDPITEKKVVDTLLKARDAGLYDCVTDCGAGGLSSAVGEMGEKLGAEVDLEKVPLKYAGLSYDEIWISEAQERMVIAVPPENKKAILDIFAAEDVEATVIGKFTDSHNLILRYDGTLVCDLAMDFLHNGIPRWRRKATWSPPSHPEPDIPEKENYGDDLKHILSSWNVCSKEWIIRQYDHEVQGGSVMKSLVGVANDGPGDACIFTPVLGSRRGIILSNGMNPKYGDIDAYHMAASAIDEALRQIIAVGGTLDQVAILDNFCWGNTDRPEQLGTLARAGMACYDIAKTYGTPFISGKDSLNNEFSTETETISIPPTLLISAIAVMDDVTKAISMDAKEAGNLIYVVGLTRNELGGSHYYSLYDTIGNNVPQVHAEEGRLTMTTLAAATQQGLIRACHDCSEGGIAVAAAEMAFAGGLGMELSLNNVPTDSPIDRDDTLLFSESNSRFIVEVEPDKKDVFEEAMSKVAVGLLGTVSESPRFKVTGLRGQTIIDDNISDLKESWQAPLRW